MNARFSDSIWAVPMGFIVSILSVVSAVFAFDTPHPEGYARFRDAMDEYARQILPVEAELRRAFKELEGSVGPATRIEIRRMMTLIGRLGIRGRPYDPTSRFLQEGHDWKDERFRSLNAELQEYRLSGLRLQKEAYSWDEIPDRVEWLSRLERMVDEYLLEVRRAWVETRIHAFDAVRVTWRAPFHNPALHAGIEEFEDLYRSALEELTRGSDSGLEALSNHVSTVRYAVAVEVARGTYRVQAEFVRDWMMRELELLGPLKVKGSLRRKGVRNSESFRPSLEGRRTEAESTWCDEMIDPVL